MGDGDEVAELVAKQEITEVLYRYCRGLDRMDRALADTVWHVDGTADYVGMFDGTADGFLDWVWVQHEALYRHSHQITNILIEVDGDRAASEAYVTVALRIKAGEDRTDIVSRGRYLDRWSRRDGRWAIDARVYVEDLQSVTPLGPVASADASPASRRDREDPSYAVLGRAPTAG
jgi:hypothetical protein